MLWVRYTNLKFDKKITLQCSSRNQMDIFLEKTTQLLAPPSSMAGPYTKDRFITYAEAGRPILWACLTYVPLQAQKFCHLLIYYLAECILLLKIYKYNFMLTLQRPSYTNSQFLGCQTQHFSNLRGSCLWLSNLSFDYISIFNLTLQYFVSFRTPSFSSPFNPPSTPTNIRVLTSLIKSSRMWWNPPSAPTSIRVLMTSLIKSSRMWWNRHKIIAWLLSVIWIHDPCQYKWK